jgi:hypothetical protein
MVAFSNLLRKKLSQTTLKKRENWKVLRFMMRRQMQQPLMIIINEDDLFCKNNSRKILAKQEGKKVSLINFL